MLWASRKTECAGRPVSLASLNRLLRFSLKPVQNRSCSFSRISRRWRFRPGREMTIMRITVR
ncbi:MAG TPA: hypothetical protein DEB17_04140 [Chlorobaculum sp.]|uniref:Uncharacterized protein n=1 Tax=Chlorobaculum tepidum (strain ATCC 49652 / DSM 12025 / NBRC 103806 / TLS) TaxID=194439 RepID=Q8KAD2_CHLTE|nr:hypothetical protein CT2231 [Chlorobaculum tepidum TLS]HBU23174.1 hypothetical protein [Chlorobaculum sp.]